MVLDFWKVLAVLLLISQMYAAQVRNLSETLMVGPPLVLVPSCDGGADVDEMETNEASMAALCQARTAR